MPKSGTKLVNAQKQNGQSFFYFFAQIFRNTHIKLVLVFGIARIVFVGAHAQVRPISRDREEKKAKLQHF